SLLNATEGSCENDLARSSTLQHYNDGAATYREKHMGTSPEVEAVRQRFINSLRRNAHILDLGAGPGRDSRFFLDQGFRVSIIEPSDELANMAEEFTGLDVRRLVAQE